MQIALSKLMLFTCLSGYTCALQKDILYQGRMFVSDHWICFHSKVFGKDTKVPWTGTEFTVFFTLKNYVFFVHQAATSLWKSPQTVSLTSLVSTSASQCYRLSCVLLKWCNKAEVLSLLCGEYSEVPSAAGVIFLIWLTANFPQDEWLTESKVDPAGLNCSSWCLSVPDRHPSGVRHALQEDQNCHPAAKRSGDRHRQWQGEKDDSWFHLIMF